MKLAVSTHWNAHRHGCGEALVQEILDLGFDRIELGYDLTLDLVPGVQHMVRSGAVRVVSVHNFCPVPLGAPAGHPELFPLASTDPRMRQTAVTHTLKTVELAADVGAPVVVVHAGSVSMKPLTPKLVDLFNDGKAFSPKYEKIRMKLLMQRERKAQKHVDALCEALEQMLPTIESAQVSLALEIMPYWEGLPTETEAETLCRRFDGERIRYWYDTGHGQARDTLGLVGSQQWLQRLRPVLAGVHLHDTVPPSDSHLMPPHGEIDFSQLLPLIPVDVPLVLEPAPGIPPDHIEEATRLLSSLAAQTQDNATRT